MEASVAVFGYIREKVFIPIAVDRWYKAFFMYYLTDILWAYALFWASLLVFKRPRKAVDTSLIAILVNEFVQLTPYICATFDWFDIVFEVLAILFGLLVSRKISRA